MAVIQELEVGRKADEAHLHAAGDQPAMLNADLTDAEREVVQQSVPTLLGTSVKQPQHPYLFWNFMEQGGKQSVLQWPWKLIHLNTGIDDATPKKAGKNGAAANAMEVQLFNMDADPAEQKNVAPENPQLVQCLDTLMREAWRAP